MDVTGRTAWGSRFYVGVKLRGGTDVPFYEVGSLMGLETVSMG